MSISDPINAPNPHDVLHPILGVRPDVMMVGNADQDGRLLLTSALRSKVRKGAGSGFNPGQLQLLTIVV